MAHNNSHSRSPVRAINAAPHLTADPPLSRNRSWSEPSFPQPEPVQAAAPDVYFGCPECGSALQLQLSPRPPQTETDAPRAAAPAEPLAYGPRAAPQPIPDFAESIREYKRGLLTRALDENDGVMTRAARSLGLKYTTFVAMVHRLEIPT